MLSVNALDFMNYKNALKGNYRKGVHAFRCILENPTQAADFAANLGGVCVVFGVPIGQDDRNSQQLLALLQASSVIDQAALTWLSQWYADYADDWDTMAGDAARATAIAGDALIWRAVGSSPVGAGKVIATIAGLSCQDYADMAAVAASQTAMAAVAASPVAVAAIWQSTVAIQVLQGNATAWATFTGASSQVMGKAVAILAGLNPNDYADMTAVAASSTAMAAVIASSTALSAVVSSSTAMTAVTASSTAMAAIEASSMAIAKYAASAAGLDPADYDDMTELAASSTAMAAVAASQTAMAAVAASKTALSACRASSTAMAKLAASSTALTALAASSLVTKYNPTSGNAWTTGTVNGSGIFIKVISYQADNNTVTIDSGSAQSISNNTNYAKAFQSKLAVYYVPYSVSGYGIYYIPC